MKSFENCGEPTDQIAGSIFSRTSRQISNPAPGNAYILKFKMRQAFLAMVARLTFMSKALSNQRGLILVGLLFAASVAPLLSVEIPAMVDYVNHLARMHLIVDAAAGRPNPAYQIDWRLDPNLAVDIIVPALARFVTVETAARLFLLASQALVVSGAIALEMAVR